MEDVQITDVLHQVTAMFPNRFLARASTLWSTSTRPRKDQWSGRPFAGRRFKPSAMYNQLKYIPDIGCTPQSDTR